MTYLKYVSDVPPNYTGQAYIEKYGEKCWYVDGLLHRDGGPAVEDDDGNKFWYQNNRLHRTDGPAVCWQDGEKSWHLNGEGYETKDEWFQALTAEQKENALWSEDVWK